VPSIVGVLGTTAEGEGGGAFSQLGRHHPKPGGDTVRRGLPQCLVPECSGAQRQLAIILRDVTEPYAVFVYRDLERHASLGLRPRISDARENGEAREYLLIGRRRGVSPSSRIRLSDAPISASQPLISI
jgi:hypothetical protein